MHTLQKIIITRLVKDNGQQYAVLTKGYDAEDNIVFHLKQLTGKGYVEKREDRYFLTASGIKLINTFQKSDLKDGPFKMMFVGFVCKNNDSFLIKKHSLVNPPFYNLPSGSPLFGEKIEIALPRIFEEETGVQVSFDTFKFDSLHLKTVKTKKDEVIFDDAFVVYIVTISDSLAQQMVFKKGSKWMNLDEIKKLENRWPEIDYCILRNNREVYKEYTIISDHHLI